MPEMRRGERGLDRSLLAGCLRRREGRSEGVKGESPEEHIEHTVNDSEWMMQRKEKESLVSIFYSIRVLKSLLPAR